MWKSIHNEVTKDSNCCNKNPNLEYNLIDVILHICTLINLAIFYYTVLFQSKVGKSITRFNILHLLEIWKCLVTQITPLQKSMVLNPIFGSI